MTPVTYPLILSRAWPIILANIAVPLLGLVDTAIIGNLGELAELGAIALGSLLFSFIYWSFGFLRMSTSGFVAQAVGAGDEAEIRAATLRPFLLALVIGLTLIVFSGTLQWIGFYLLHGSDEVEASAALYFQWRIFGAPASLGLFVLFGTLIGMGLNRRLLAMQIFLNGSNILLDIVFAGVLKMGVKGIALGTVIAEYVTLIVCLLMVIRVFQARRRDREPLLPWLRVQDLAKLKNTLAANRDVMLRTLCMVFGFYWFVDQSARFGDATLAANHILMQFVTFSAFFLDGFAFVAESLVGTSIGARQKHAMQISIRRTTLLAAIASVLLALSVIILGDFAARQLTDIVAVQSVVHSFKAFAAAYVLFSFAAFQLDGIFIGATLSAQMRNAAFMAVSVFLFAWYITQSLGNTGLWLAMLIYVVARALALLAFYSELNKKFE